MNNSHTGHYSIAKSEPAHSTHNTEDIVIASIDTNLSSIGTLDGSIRENKLKSSIVNAGEVAGTGWLMLLRLESERVDIDTSVWGSAVMLPRLYLVEVSTLTLREAILTVELELGSDDWILTPAVHVKSGLSKYEGTCIRNGGSPTGGVALPLESTTLAETSCRNTHTVGASSLEETRCIDETIVTIYRGLGAECSDGVWKSIDRVSVVEWLSTKSIVENSATLGRGAVVDIAVWLDNPDELLARVVEVEADLVRRRTNRLSTSVLKLLNEILMRILGKASALISVKVDVVNIEGSRDKRLGVSLSYLLVCRGLSKRADSPEALIDCAKINVDLDLVVLESNEWESKSWVVAEPELEWDVESGLWKGIAWSTYLARSRGITRTINWSEGWISEVGKLSGLTNHLKVTSLAILVHGELIPDVHPVTVLLVNSLTTDLELNIINKLMAWEIKPAGVDSTTGWRHVLINLWESNLKVGAVSKITISGDSAGDSATKVRLAIESLLNRLHGKVSVATISHLPESNLWITSKINVLSAVSYKLHKTTSHFIYFEKKKKYGFNLFHNFSKYNLNK
jgi:hypothetical protein